MGAVVRLAPIPPVRVSMACWLDEEPRRARGVEVRRESAGPRALRVTIPGPGPGPDRRRRPETCTEWVLGTSVPGTREQQRWVVARAGDPALLGPPGRE